MGLIWILDYDPYMSLRFTFKLFARHCRDIWYESSNINYQLHWQIILNSLKSYLVLTHLTLNSNEILLFCKLILSSIVILATNFVHHISPDTAKIKIDDVIKLKLCFYTLLTRLFKNKGYFMTVTKVIL